MDIEVHGFSVRGAWPEMVGPSVRRILREELARASRHRYPLGVVLLDPGVHPRGGEYRCELLYAIGLAVRAGDRVCLRDAGDILILLPGIPADRLPIRIRALSCAARTASRFAAGAPVLRWGTAAFPRDGALPGALLAAASAAAQSWSGGIDNPQCACGRPAAR
jgi:hypothetical protein